MNTVNSSDNLSSVFSLSQPSLPIPADLDSELAADFAELDDEDFEDFEFEDEESEMPPVAEMLQAMFLGFELPAFAERLASLDDGLPLPQVFDWKEALLPETVLDFNADDRRTYAVFRQIVEQERKSGKYLQAMQALCARYPDSQELQLDLVAYLTQWHPEAGQSLSRELLAAHPEWLLVRLHEATRLILQAPDADLPDEAPSAFVELLQHKLELHQHLEGRQATTEEVFAFYHATAAYYIATGHFERAIYSLNACACIEPGEALEPLLLHLLIGMDETERGEEVREFLNPMLMERVKQIRSAKQSFAV